MSDPLRSIEVCEVRNGQPTNDWCDLEESCDSFGSITGFDANRSLQSHIIEVLNMMLHDYDYGPDAIKELVEVKQVSPDAQSFQTSFYAYRWGAEVTE
jgi:hypothetical protein